MKTINIEHPTISYMICATPRSGSSLLCEALRNTDLAGNPDEYFGPIHVTRWNKKWHTISESDYLEKVIAIGKGENGVWGSKVMRLYWKNFTSLLQSAYGAPVLSENDLLKAFFPDLQYIWITRRDKVRQAISWLKFVQGSAWYWEEDEPQKLEKLVFKPKIIREFISQTVIHETAWLEFFRKNEIQPSIVVFEDFINEYEETAKKLLRKLGILHQENLIFGQRRMKKQSDNLTDEWVKKYIGMYKDKEKM